jgi:hypothetical protein
MGLPKWAGVGLRIAGLVFPQIAAVEAAARAIGGLKGKQKQDAVVELFRASVEAAEGLAGKQIFDAETEAATRTFIDAAVAYQNFLAEKQARAHDAATGVRFGDGSVADETANPRPATGFTNTP